MNKVITTKQDYGYHISFTGNIPSKKNSKQIVCRGSRPMLLPSKSYTTWHTACCESLKMARIGAIRCIEVHLYDKLNKDGTEPKRLFDLTNKTESLFDLFVDVGMIEDDNYKIIPQVILSFGGYRDEQGAEVFIYLDNN